MALVVPAVRYCWWIVIAAIAIYWLAARFVACPLYTTWKAKVEKDDWYLKRKWHRFTNEFETWFIVSAVATGIAVLFMVIGIGITEAQIYENHQLESYTYAMYKTEYNTLNRIIKTSTDLVNTDIYSRINEYNKEVTAFHSQYNTPAFAFNFTGECNWNDLQLITLKEKS